MTGHGSVCVNDGKSFDQFLDTHRERYLWTETRLFDLFITDDIVPLVWVFSRLGLGKFKIRDMFLDRLTKFQLT